MSDVKAPRTMTFEEYMNMKDEPRLEYFEGKTVQKAAPSADHSFAETSIAAALLSFRGQSGSSGRVGGWWIGTEPSVVYEKRPHGFVHDLAGWRRDRYPARPSGTKIKERPDWVCEIMSTNKTNDVVTKRTVLHEHGVEHYWLIDVEHRFVSVYRWDESGYLLVTEVLAGTKARLEPFDALELEVSVLLGDDPTD